MRYDDFKTLKVQWKLFKKVGAKKWLQYFFFQRILRINSNVPWPVHWASIVVSPQKIEIDGLGPPLGDMPGVYVQAMNGIKIGKNLRTGPGVKIISSNHNLLNYAKHDVAKPITIGDNCWLGANSVILPGVELGNHVVIAAGAVVTKSFKGNCVLAGVPAKVIKSLPNYES